MCGISYLFAPCLVQTPTELCDRSTGIPVSSLVSGYLANLVTEATGCGNVQCPWVIEVKPGQSIVITLYDFSLTSVSRYQNEVLLYSSNLDETFNDDLWPGQPYAFITEPLIGRNITVYGRMRSRKTAVFTSQTRRVHVAILTSDDVMDIAYFMLQYEGE